LIISSNGDRVCLQCGMLRLEPRNPWFNPGTSHMGFVVDKVDLGEVSSLRVPRLSSKRHAANDS